MDALLTFGFTSAAAVACAALMYVHWYGHDATGASRNQSVPQASPGERCVVLTAFESAPIVSMFPAISTVTIFQGDPDAAEAHLRARVADVVSANPWLEGRLSRGGPEKRVYLLFSEFGGTLNPLTFAVAHENADLCDHGLGYMALTERLTPYLVPKSGDCIDAPQPVPLFRVTLIREKSSTAPSEHSGRFAVCVSLCHAFADGHTFYNLHGMLSTSALAVPLSVERLVSFEQDCDAVLGGNDSLAWMGSPGAILKVLWNLAFAPRPQVLLRTVTAPWIESQKAAAASLQDFGGPVAFVSTNDVLTSWLWRQAGTDVGFMAVNLRGRIPALTQNHAGNYEALVAYQVRD